MKRIEVKECHVCGEPLLSVRRCGKVYSIGSKIPLDKYTIYVSNQKIEARTRCDHCGCGLNIENLVYFMEHLYEV